MQTRWSAYAGVSVALAGGVVVKALAQRPNFYSAAVYLSQSSANLMILTNMVFVVACSILLGLQKLLYGPLRPIEIEQLYEKAWFAVTETCLAMTIFRGEIGSWFFVMFFSLLAGKVWAWIGEGRVEILEQQPPRDPRLFHTRLALSLGLSVVFDLSMLEFIIKEVMRMPKPDMMVMFGFEFAVLSIISLSTAARYAVNLVEIGILRKQKAQRIEDIKRERREAAIREVLNRTLAARRASTTDSTTAQADTHATETPSVTLEAADAARSADQQPVDEAEIEVEGWEGKGRWMFYLDLATDFFKLVVYLSFFFILLAFYGLPIHILRDVFLTCRSFIKRISDFIKYRNATRDMNARYPDATEQDFGREDVCIICREEMRPYEPPAENQPPNPVAERMRPKKLPCGHVLHFSCLRSWLERQQICPTCRTSVTPSTQTTGNTTAGGAQGAAGQQHPPAPAARGRGGVIRLGPLRIAVGAVRGNNIVGDLQQRLGAGDGQPAAPEPVNNNAPHQYGFGIRWEGMRRRERREHRHRSIQDQLQALERQIQQEVNSLGASMTELHILRNMEAQLALLRRQRQAVTATIQPIPAGSTTTVHNLAQTQTQLVGDSSARLTAGDPNLPAGLILPEGWTMTPLSATNAPNPPPSFQGQTFGATMPFMPNPALAMQARGGATGPVPFPPFQFQRHANHVLNQSTNQPQDSTSQANQPSQPNQNSNTTTNPNAETRSLADVMAAIADPERMQREHGMHDSQEQPRQRAPSTSTGTETEGTSAAQSSESSESASRQAATAPSTRIPALPVWGSNSSQSIPPSSTSSTSVQNGTASTKDAGGAPASEGVQEDSYHESTENNAAASEKRRNPTVEDLVEDPD